MFCTFHTLIGFVRREGAGTIEYDFLLAPFHICYIFLIAFGLTWEFGAFCNDEVVYPWIFTVADVLFGLSYIFVAVATMNGYWIKWEKRTCKVDKVS